jgi:NhaA family Na+:H+ antiporter
LRLSSRLASLWARPAQRFVPPRLIRTAQEYLRTEATSGIVLLVAAVVALVWINTFEQSYLDLWHTEVSIDLSLFTIEEPLQEWINEGLMTIFFFGVGLEIKREIDHGELSDFRRAALPAFAAVGGMVGPALIYTAFNASGDASRGWGIPMATDIAFAVGVLSLTARHAPFSLRIFLLALAIVDDIGAIIIIAVFYTASVSLEALAYAGLLFAAIVALNRLGVRNINVYVIIGALFWVAMLKSGVHATLAGVTLGLLTPSWAFYSRETFLESAETITQRFRRAMQADNEDEQNGLLAQMEELSRETEAPLERLERYLHPWISYGIVPLFALANAGVVLSSDAVEGALSHPVTLGVALGLVVGKPVGIFLATFVAVKLRICDLPTGTSWLHIVGVGLIGGVGFTVSLFITGLAFESVEFVDEAKIGILGGSVLAAALGLAFMRYLTREVRSSTAAS